MGGKRGRYREGEKRERKEYAVLGKMERTPFPLVINNVEVPYRTAELVNHSEVYAKACLSFLSPLFMTPHF